MAELPDDIYAELKRLCAEGDRVAEVKNYQGAVGLYRQAWQLIPEPQTDWSAATWVLAAIADAYWFNGDYEYARDALEYAMHCPDAIGNPFLHLRLGQVCLELKHLDRAADELTRAYMGGGPDIFEGEPPKFFEFLKTRIVL